MLEMRDWEVGKEIVVAASEINHNDKREITLKYLGDGYLEDVSNGNRVWFNDKLFSKVYEGMCISLGLPNNILVCESYDVIKVL